MRIRAGVWAFPTEVHGMDLHHLIERFSASSKRCETEAELFSLAEAAARELGFEKLAIVHGLSFRWPGRRLIRMDNFGEWADLFIEQKYYLDDPVLLTCQRTNIAFPWQEMQGLIPFTKRHERVIREAARHGLRNGFTLPVGVIGEPPGCCSFVTGKARLPSRARRRAASLIGAEAFCQARRLSGYPARARYPPRLSRRKLECLRYLALGKTDGEIAIILGLSHATIRTYMTLLRRDFDVVSRAQLAVAALRFGFIGFDDAIPSS
jgi:DNA-binding CsgD family transcriptional regulator